MVLKRGIPTMFKKPICKHKPVLDNINNGILQAFQLIVLDKYLLGVLNPSPVSQHALT